METQQKKIAVLILNLNGKELLKKFLPSVIQNNNNHADIIVIDNNSSDDSVNFIKKYYPKIKCIVNIKNYGYAEAYNIVIKKLDYEFVVLLNSDVRVSKNWIDAPLEFLESNIEYAACQPKILDEKKPNMFEYAGASGGFIDFLGYPFCRGRILNHIETDNGQYDSTIDIMWASGAALFLRTNYFKKAGGFDITFFAHQEEIDLCWRFQNMGYKIACIPSSHVFHLGGATLSKQNTLKTYLNFRNNLIMLLKNLPKTRLPIIIIRLILDSLAGLKFIFEGKPIHFFAIIKAYFSFYRRAPIILLKRTKTKHLSTKVKFSGSIIVEYYLKGIKIFSKIYN
tara:strand:- start:407 stop:1423 length:1017 start_codon:yes stop_codon:yes gene_type:complete